MTSRTKVPSKRVSSPPTAAAKPNPKKLTLVPGTNNKSMLLADKKTKANGEAMRAAAKKLGVTAPKTRGGKSDQELLGSLRIEIDKRLKALDETEHVACPVCLEVATSDTDYCPFCGDQGGEEEAVVPAVAAQVTAARAAKPQGVAIAKVPGVGIAKTPVPTAPNVEVATKALAKELDVRLARIEELKKNAVGLSYDMGVECRAIRDQQLFKARGYSSFQAFAKDELPFTRESALQLISIVEKHTREDYGDIGYAKLRVIAAVTDDAIKDELLRAARKGATTKEIVERAARLTGVPQRKSTLPEKGERITLIGKIGARNQVVKFHEVDGGEVIESAGTFKSFSPDVYGELEVADGVFCRIGLRVNATKELEGLTVRFVRASDEAE